MERKFGGSGTTPVLRLQYDRHVRYVRACGDEQSGLDHVSDEHVNWDQSYVLWSQQVLFNTDTDAPEIW